MMEEMSVQVSLENCQGFNITDGGGKFIPPARNGEWKRSGEWFDASQWWHHEASLMVIWSINMKSACIFVIPSLLKRKHSLTEI